MRAFGKPSHIRRGNFNCKVTWRDKRLKIAFTNLGGGHHDACSRRFASAQGFVIKRSRKWRTTKHLTVGQSLDRLRDLYPGARHHGAYWWLHTGHFPGCSCRFAVVSARVQNGRVIGFKGHIGGAGE